MDIEQAAVLGAKICDNIAGVIVGKADVIKLACTALFAGGHMLLDDVPGTGKTMLAKALARSIKADFHRVQFTPDLLPSDLTGISYYNQKQSDFVFRKGPVFTNILLADEINRATPRTQSSLLECMEERQVTVDGSTYRLSDPFFVIATQNPVETRGTFPLPEAQLDRFIIRTSVGYPATADAATILGRFRQEDPLEKLEPVCTGDDIAQAAAAARGVYLSDELAAYIIAIVERTRSFKGVELGVSPRGSLSLLHACQARAMLAGRSFITPEDIKSLAPFVLSHRIILKDDYGGVSTDADKIISEILYEIPVPSEKWE